MDIEERGVKLRLTVVDTPGKFLMLKKKLYNISVARFCLRGRAVPSCYAYV